MGKLGEGKYMIAAQAPSSLAGKENSPRGAAFFSAHRSAEPHPLRDGRFSTNSVAKKKLPLKDSFFLVGDIPSV